MMILEEVPTLVATSRLINTVGCFCVACVKAPINFTEKLNDRILLLCKQSVGNSSCFHDLTLPVLLPETFLRLYVYIGLVSVLSGRKGAELDPACCCFRWFKSI